MPWRRTSSTTAAAEGGVGDFLKRIDVDCRKTYAITSNKLLNDAMMSRVEPIPTYEDGAHVRGRTKLQKSTCESNSLASQAASLMVQYVMSASVFVWAFHACGGSSRTSTRASSRSLWPCSRP